jgi:hypothetical protein
VELKVDEGPTEIVIDSHCELVLYKDISAYGNRNNPEKLTSLDQNTWKESALAGVRYGLITSGCSQSKIIITRIIGLQVSTNAAVVGASAIFAIWQTCGFKPSSQLIRHVERVVFLSLDRPHDIPHFD